MTGHIEHIYVSDLGAWPRMMFVWEVGGEGGGLLAGWPKTTCQLMTKPIIIMDPNCQDCVI